MMTITEISDYLHTKVLNSPRYVSREPIVGDYYLIAATLDKKGRIIAIGENSIKTHPIMEHYSKKMRIKHKIHLHAEISALVKSYQKSHSILVIRVNRSGNLAMAKPCPICQAAIDDAHIKHVYYSDIDGDIVYLNKEDS